MTKNFAIGTWEINLQAQIEREYIFTKLNNVCEYIDTAIDYNNDYLLPRTYKLISKISSYHYNKYEFFISNHLKCLNRGYIDIMLIHSSRGNWKPLAKKMITDTRFKEIGVSNFSKAEIEEFIALTNYVPKYNEIEINPYYYDKETIDYCKSMGIKIIAYGIFTGKYTAMQTIADYSLPYLLMYAGNIADIVIIKPESFRQVDEFLDIVNNFNFNTVDFKFDYSNKNLETTKSIVPMRYTAKDIKKTFYGIQTYFNACGKNHTNNELIIEQISIDEVFEMLGDYQVYIRYKYRQNYNTKHIYDYDFLIGDDQNYYIVHILDNEGRLTKINKNNKVFIYKVIGGKINGI